MSTITLLTDFGTRDEYVGVMKGVILSVNPAARIVDITHDIEPQDLVGGAYAVKASYGYFPRGTVHLIVVDPGVGSERRILAVAREGHIFIAPDNGILTLVLKEGRADALVHVENARYFLHPVSRTFHGRDIFAPVGAQISRGLDLRAIGRSVDQREVALLDLKVPRVAPRHGICGTIVCIDRFGNMMTNIDEATLGDFCASKKTGTPDIEVGGRAIAGVSCSYAAAEIGSPLAIVGSRGYLEIAVNRGSAKDYFDAKRGDPVRVVLPD